MFRNYCQFCRRLIETDFGDPHVCHACLDARLDERFARWDEEHDPMPRYDAPPAAA